MRIGDVLEARPSNSPRHFSRIQPSHIMKDPKTFVTGRAIPIAQYYVETVENGSSVSGTSEIATQTSRRAQLSQLKVEDPIAAISELLGGWEGKGYWKQLAKLNRDQLV